MSTAFKRGRSPNTVLSPGASSVSGSVVSNNRLKSINRPATQKVKRAAAVRNGPFNNSANERSEGMGNSEEMLINNRRGIRTAARGAAANVFGQVRAATSPKTRPKTPLQKQKNKTLKPRATISKLKRSIPRTAAQGAAAAAIERNLREKRLKNLISLRNKLPNVLKAKYTNDALRKMSTRENITAIQLKMMQSQLSKATNQVKKSPNKPANSRRNSVTTLPSARGIAVNNANSKIIGKGKEGILKVIKKLASDTQKRNNAHLSGLMPQIPVNSIKEYYAYAYAILYDMVDMMEATKLKDVSVDAIFIQEIHNRIMRLNEYSSGRSGGSLGDRKHFTFNLNNDDVVEFLFLIWLDGSHDEYFKNLSFKDFLNSAFCTNFFNPNHIQLAKDFVTAMPDATKIFNNNARLNSIIKKYKDKTKFKKDKADLFNGKFNNRFSTILNICIEAESVWFFIHEHNPKMFKDSKGKVISVSKKLLGRDYEKLKETFEKVLKTNIGEILGVKTTNLGITRTGLSSKMKGTQTRLVSLDYQSQFATIDAFINKTSQFRPYVTAGNMIDAGKHMLKSSVYKNDIAMLTRVLRDKKPEIMNNKTNAALEAHYHVGPLNFSIKNNGQDFFKVNLNIRKEGPSNNNTNNMYSGNFFDLKINDKAVLLGATAKNAGGRGANNQSNASPQAMMGKFMGDALQYMVVAIQNKYRGKNRIFGSGDGSACFMYAYMCKKLNIPPRLLVDVGGSNKIVTYAGLNRN